MQLENKSTIVTGGASGVGKAIAERFAREGARVTVADINEQGVGQVVESIQSRGVWRPRSCWTFLFRTRSTP